MYCPFSFFFPVSFRFPVWTRRITFAGYGAANISFCFVSAKFFYRMGACRIVAPVRTGRFFRPGHIQSGQNISNLDGKNVFTEHWTRSDEVSASSERVRQHEKKNRTTVKK
jgi:hypothetical protein